MPRAPDGWRSTERRRPDGAIDSEQRLLARRPAVEPTAAGARLLGSRYWLEVTRASRGLVRCRESARGVELLLPGLPWALLTLGPPQIAVDGDRLSCSYPILGGLLARRAGGSVSLVQSGRGRPELRVAVQDFSPRLGVLYEPLQRPFHVSVSRRFLSRLATGERA